LFAKSSILLGKKDMGIAKEATEKGAGFSFLERYISKYLLL
jgi:hypothetical protein